MNKELVVASYNETLDWIKDVPRAWRRTIYRATEGLAEERPDRLGKLPIIRIPNGGREAGQYFWHIIHRRSQLADITLFVQGDFPKHGKISDISGIQSDPRPMAYLGVPVANERPWPHPLGEMSLALHRVPWGSAPPSSGMFSVGAQIWASRKTIRAVPASVYKKYYGLRHEPHFAHLLEPSWHTVFGVYR